MNNEVILGLPRTDVPDSQKNKEYHIRFAKAVHALTEDSKSGVDSRMRNWFSLMRLYGQGRQPDSLYRDYKFGENSAPVADTDSSYNSPSKGARTGTQNLDYNIISIMPRIKDKLLGLLQGVDYNVLVDTVDVASGAEKERKKWALWVQRQHGEFINQFKQNADIPVQQPDYLPGSVYELNTFDVIGGFKLDIARSMEKLIQHGYEISDWDGELRDACVNDLVDISHAILKVVLDPEDGKWHLSYVDPEDAVFPYSRNNDFSEMTYAGHYSLETISDLRLYMDVPEKELAEYAMKNGAMYGNPATTSNFDSFTRQGADGSYGYDNFRVKVLHLEWIDEAKKKNLYHTNKYGRKSAFSLGEDEEYKPNDRQDVKVTVYRVLRKCSWVVGSELVYDWGLSNYMDRPEKNKVIPNYIVIKLNNLSITERLKPVMDDIMISWLKYQEARATAIKGGYAIDFSMINNISDGDKKYSMLEILEMWRDSGLLIFQGSLSGRYEGGAVSPVQPIPSTILNMITEASQMWSIAMKRIEDITGLSAVALGAMPQGETARGTELSVAATADILKPIIKKVLTLKEKSASAMMRRFQMFCRGGEVSVYEPLLGASALKRLKEMEKTPVQYGLSFEAKPSFQEKQDLISVVQASMNNRRQGMAGISLSDGAWAIEQINHGGNFKEIRMIIAYQEEKHRMQLQQEKENAIRLQGEQNNQLKQMEIEGKKMELQSDMQKIQAESRSKLDQIQASLMADILKEYLKSNPEEARTFIAGGNSQNKQGYSPSEAVSAPGGGVMPPAVASV